MTHTGHMAVPGRRLLVVDDDAADAHMVRDAFAPRLVEVMHASSVRSALTLLEYGWDSTPHLVLLDLNLPTGSGTRLLEERRRRDAWQQIPVVVFSSSDVHRQACMELGATEYVVKPATVRELTQTVDDLVCRFLQ